MKISDFELGKKYTRKSWESKTYVEYNEKDDGNYVLLAHYPLLGEHIHRTYVPNFKDTSADDWIEIKEFKYKKEETKENEDNVDYCCELHHLLAHLFDLKTKKGDK